MAAHSWENLGGGVYKNIGVELFKHDRKSVDGGALGEEAAPEVWGLGERAIMPVFTDSRETIN